ncbi:hypothetical protein AK812_SmicGene14541 [Symbiodinium microadriaticum]|uniref:Uncharacterized protein n=1 Tax=Symbiodinium microadriaticum TaxID=2951 RepID=A0A1Q9E5A1_SYMMI|nr:hypothetical protein AK812_SmicGene14541 [Symbiodinium microadriaticum]
MTGVPLDGRWPEDVDPRTWKIPHACHYQELEEALEADIGAVRQVRRWESREKMELQALLVAGVVSVLQPLGMWASGFLKLLFRRQEDAFVTPKLRGEALRKMIALKAAATMAAALIAASVAAPGPAQAESPKLSFFGLGGGVSDVYNQNDNPINPYSQFSEVGDESVYKARTDQEAPADQGAFGPTGVARRKKALANSFERFDKTAFYIKTKQSQQLTSNLQEAAGFKQVTQESADTRSSPLTMQPFHYVGYLGPLNVKANSGADMVYFSGAEGSPAYNKAREFSQKISTVGVDGRNKEWGRASQDFEAAKELLKDWKELVKF